MDSGLDSDLLDWKKCVGDAVARVAVVVVFVFETCFFFLFSILYSKEGTNKTPTTILLSASLS
jgi:uncharacterized membrane protein YadS